MGERDLLISKIFRIRADEQGATAVEYGLILALMFLAMVGGMSILGSESSGLWAGVETKVTDAMSEDDDSEEEG